MGNERELHVRGRGNEEMAPAGEVPVQMIGRAIVPAGQEDPGADRILSCKQE